MRALLLSLLATTLMLTAAVSHAAPAVHRLAGLPFVRVPAGRYRPLYRPTPQATLLPVAAFLLMTRPVTNEEFLEFVRHEPNYRRDRIARIFAETGYLAHWSGATVLGEAVRPRQPVTHVSWFAARAFCASKGFRLPLEAEWERAAVASSTRADASRDARQRKTILDWYATPRADLPDVPAGPANFFGVHDLHGVAWEWVDDFNNSAVDADAREQGESARDSFCGGGALRAEDATDYATFMRVAMRSSLQASYTNANLTFRCAADPETIHANK
jgi:sulfatase modifying factor 1